MITREVPPAGDYPPHPEEAVILCQIRHGNPDVWDVAWVGDISSCLLVSQEFILAMLDQLPWRMELKGRSPKYPDAWIAYRAETPGERAKFDRLLEGVDLGAEAETGGK